MGVTDEPVLYSHLDGDGSVKASDAAREKIMLMHTMLKDVRINHTLCTEFTGTGIAGSFIDVSSRVTAHIVVEDVGASNVIEVNGRIKDGTDTLLATLTGPVTKKIIDVDRYSELRFDVTTYDPSGTPKIRAAFYTFVGIGKEAQDALDAILAALGGSMNTTQFQKNDTVGTTEVSVPTASGDDLRECLIHNTSVGNKDLLVSFDGGTTFKTLTPDANIIWDVKKALTQIKLKGSVAGTAYEVILNREA